jgi:drug/metabolite transporter (DMT)-like permease
MSQAMSHAFALAASSAVCFGVALVTSRKGLRFLDPRAGAAISIPTATVLFVLAAPFAIDPSAFSLPAAGLFALVGVVFPAVVTLLTFRANERLGPTTTGAISGTSPLFAMLAAALLLGEQLSSRAVIASVAVVAGIALLSWQRGAMRPAQGWALLWPLAGALVRGVAQTGARAGLLLWPNPFAASVIGYLVSSATVLGANGLRRVERPHPSRSALGWFALTGVLNGGAMLLMYGALSRAPVAEVAPVVAAYPLVTVSASALVLREEPITLQLVAGTLVTVLAIIYLLGGFGLA